MVVEKSQLSGLSVLYVACGFIVFVLGQNPNVVLSVAQPARILIISVLCENYKCVHHTLLIFVTLALHYHYITILSTEIYGLIKKFLLIFNIIHTLLVPLCKQICG